MELDGVEQRILGCLVEKAATTPQTYPLTVNALRLACNQTTNRDPIVDYDEPTLDAALASLRSRGLTRIVYSPSNRAAKHRHVLDEGLELRPDEVAVIAILLLRGEQTVGEIKGRTERLYPFASLADTEATLELLAGREEPLVIRRERRPGQKDVRWGHLLGAPQSMDDGGDDTGDDPGDDPGDDGEEPVKSAHVRLVEVEAAVADLTDQVAELRMSLEALQPERGV